MKNEINPNPTVIRSPAELSVEELKDAILKEWQGPVREKMAPMLYFLHAKLRAPGSKGEGFEAWVKKNLGIPIRTVNRWITEYAEQNGKPHKKRRTKDSSGQVAETADQEDKEETKEPDPNSPKPYRID